MLKIRTTVFLVIFLTIFSFAVNAHAADNSCQIMAGPQNDVWVIVYDADADGNRNQVLWEGKIEAGKKIPITSTNGHIRYNFKLDPNQPYQGDLSRACFGQKTIEVD